MRVRDSDLASKHAQTHPSLGKKVGQLLREQSLSELRHMAIVVAAPDRARGVRKRIEDETQRGLLARVAISSEPADSDQEDAERPTPGSAVRIVRLKKNGTIVPIVPYSLPYFVGRFTIRGDGRGVINDGRGLSERLQWLGRRHLQPLRLAWARAGQPAWSPRGQWIAVTGSTAADSPKSATARWSLYLLDDQGSPVRTLAQGLQEPTRPAWSPNGRWLALTMTWTNGVRGIYVIDTKTRKVSLARPGFDYGNIAWIDNSRLLAAVPRKTHRQRAGLEELQLTNLNG